MFQFLNANLLASPWYFFCALSRPEIDENVFLSWYEAMDNAYELHGWVDPESHIITPALSDLYDTKERFNWKELCFNQLTEIKNLRFKRCLPPLGIVVPAPAPKRARIQPAAGGQQVAREQPRAPPTPEIMSSVPRSEWPGIFDD